MACAYTGQKNPFIQILLYLYYNPPFTVNIQKESVIIPTNVTNREMTNIDTCFTFTYNDSIPQYLT